MEKVISYIGSKVKLYDFLEETILKNHNSKEIYNFCDLFAGTNSVSHFIKKNTNWNIYGNDFSKYSYVLFDFILFDLIDIKTKEEIINLLEKLDNLPLIKGDIFHEFSVKGEPKTIEKNKKEEMFHNQEFNSRMFFSEKVGQKIDTVKNKLIEMINNKEITNPLIINTILIFILNYADKNSNTTSVYGAYLKNTKKMEKENPFINEKLINQLKTKTERNNQNIYKCYNTDIRNVLDTLKMELTDTQNTIVYLDPPYSTRTYESNYHILEYIVDLEFSPLKDIKINSKTAQKKERTTNPFAAKKHTYSIFKDMITKSLEISNNIYISYKTDGLIKQEDIEKIVEELNIKSEKNIELITYKKSYKRFKSANNDLKKLQEEKNRILHNRNKTETDNIRITEIEQELSNYEKEKEENQLFEIIWYIEQN